MPVVSDPGHHPLDEIRNPLQILRTRRLVTLLLYFVLVGLASAQAPPHTFTANEHQFLMDGKPLQIISGEMHYPRVPRAYWRDRFQKARAMGRQTVRVKVQ